MVWLPENQDEIDALKELDGAPGQPPVADRAAAIIAASIVETRLAPLLAHLHQDKKITNDLFRSGAALGYFGTKIDLGYLIGLYSKTARENLDIIKEIRNDFWPAAGSKDTELGVLMEPEVGHGTTEIYTRVQA